MGGESGRSQFKQTLVEFSVVQEVQVKHGFRISSLEGLCYGFVENIKKGRLKAKGDWNNTPPHKYRKTRYMLIIASIGDMSNPT